MENNLLTDRNLNRLQQSFVDMYTLTFPDFLNETQIVEGIMNKNNFCISIKSKSEKFGDLCLDISDNEITLFTDYDHKHFSDFVHDTEDESEKIWLTCKAAMEDLNDYLTGNRILELHLSGENLVKVRQYNKNEPSTTASTAIYFNIPYYLRTFTSKLKRIFGIKTVDKTIVRLNWFGEVVG